jgi:hypothetical protein
MMDRNKVSFWTRVGALALAVIFLVSFAFVGIGANADINLLGLFGGSQDQNQEQAQTSDPQEQVSQAEQELEGDPENPRLIRRHNSVFALARPPETARLDRRCRCVVDGWPIVRFRPARTPPLWCVCGRLLGAGVWRG